MSVHAAHVVDCEVKLPETEFFDLVADGRSDFDVLLDNKDVPCC